MPHVCLAEEDLRPAYPSMKFAQISPCPLCIADDQMSLHAAEGSYQTAWVSRLMRVFAGYMCCKACFSTEGLIYGCQVVALCISFHVLFQDLSVFEKEIILI